MKNFTFLLLLITLLLSIFLSCDAPAQNDPVDLRVAFKPNLPDHGVTFYEVYWWQGDDTTAYGPGSLVLTDTVNWALADTLLSGYQPVFRNFMRAGVRSRNTEGLSVVALTRFYSYFEFNAPPPPQILGVVR